MPLILVGYGDFEDYRLEELSMEALEQLSVRYSLTVAEDFSPEYDDLMITVAVHAELNRRNAGGQQHAHIPSRRELAELIINKGFPQASKHYHPDKHGPEYNDVQVRLSEVRAALLADCENIPNDRPDNAVFIPAPPEKRATRSRAANATGWNLNDDDIPF